MIIYAAHHFLSSWSLLFLPPLDGPPSLFSGDRWVFRDSSTILAAGAGAIGWATLYVLGSLLASVGLGLALATVCAPGMLLFLSACSILTSSLFRSLMSEW